jgi:ParB family transcriptional regulator, chromosome partitioning protein
MAQRPSLGKGLASLLPSAGPMTALEREPSPHTPPIPGSSAVSAGPPAFSSSVDPGNRDRHPGIAMLLVDEIAVNPYQPRREFDEKAIEELAASIRANGIIQPLVVRKGTQGYVLIAGERRLRASKVAGLKQVPVVVRKSTDREALEIAIVENVQRENLNCIDEALGYFQLMQDFALTQEEVATRMGKDRASVANHLRLLKLPEAIIDDLKRQILSFGHGKVLLSLDDQDLRLRARAQIVQKKLSVRETEQLVEALRRGQSVETPAAPSDASPLSPVQARFRQLALDLTRAWSSRVEIKGTEKRGKITINYANRQELEKLISRLQG